MNRDEKFVMEKLRELDDAEIIEPSDELRSRLAQIKFPEKSAPVSAPAKRSWRVPVFSALSAVAVACVILLCCIFIPFNSDTIKDYNDEDLERHNLTYEELTASHTVLLPNADIDVFTVYRDIKSKKHVYCLFEIKIKKATLKTQIVFVNNYTIAEKAFYTNPPYSSTTSLFTYHYNIHDAHTAHASCEYGGYRYYFKYTADDPQAITEIMNNLQYHTN